jgi:hypothetical protein
MGGGVDSASGPEAQSMPKSNKKQKSEQKISGAGAEAPRTIHAHDLGRLIKITQLRFTGPDQGSSAAL